MGKKNSAKDGVVIKIICFGSELGTIGIFVFFQQQKMIFCIFYQVNLTGSGLFKWDWCRIRLLI